MNHRISRQLEYALMALDYMSSRKGQRVAVREMVEKLHCPFDPLSRVLQKMADQGVVQSQKGLGGGYCFSGDLNTLSFYDLMVMILRPVEVVSCLSGDCELLQTCNIRTPIRVFNDRLKDFYKSLSLQEILNPKDTKAVDKPLKQRQTVIMRKNLSAEGHIEKTENSNRH